MDFRGMFKNQAFTFLQAGLHHTIHHRGQLSTYLRPMGGKVPAIYGESYDSAQAKKGRAGRVLIKSTQPSSPCPPDQHLVGRSSTRDTKTDPDARR